MSGFEQLEPRGQLLAFFRSQAHPVALHYRVMNDSEGSIFTASPTGGLVIIAGTGSIAQRITPEGASARCGGMGHMFSDGGWG
jgi:N-acetylglucosamine kinase